MLNLSLTKWVHVCVCLDVYACVCVYAYECVYLCWESAMSVGLWKFRFT